MASKSKPKPTPKPYDPENPFGNTSFTLPNWMQPGAFSSNEGFDFVTEGQPSNPGAIAQAKRDAVAYAARNAREAGAARFTKAPTGIRKVAAAPSPSNANPGNVNIVKPSAGGSSGGSSSSSSASSSSGFQSFAGPGASGAGTSQSLADMVAGNYAGASKSLADQIAALQDRYGQNKADVTSILGNLSTIRAADVAKINQQFTNSIQASQDQQAARTAQAQAQLKLGQQGAATAGAELGGGPTEMPTDSLTSQAVAQGIADANAYQGTWGNLMNLTNAQEQANALSSANGYNQQQAAALDQLRRDYQDRLLGFQGQQYSLQDQIAQGVSGIQANQSEMQQENYLQQLKNQGITDAAKIRAAGQLAAKQAGGGNNTTKYSKDIYGFQQRVTDTLGPTAFSDISASVDAARQLATKRKSSAATATGKTAKAPSASEVLSAWKALGGTPQYLPYVQDFINKY